jgi:hypothetical protein
MTDPVCLVSFEPMQRETILVRVDRDGPQTQLIGRPHDTDRNLASICDH